MIAYYWKTREGSLPRLAIYVAAFVVLMTSTVLGGHPVTFPILLISAVGIAGIADEYRRWRRANRARPAPPRESVHQRR